MLTARQPARNWSSTLNRKRDFVAWIICFNVECVLRAFAVWWTRPAVRSSQCRFNKRIGVHISSRRRRRRRWERRWIRHRWWWSKWALRRNVCIITFEHNTDGSFGVCDGFRPLQLLSLLSPPCDSSLYTSFMWSGLFSFHPYLILYAGFWISLLLVSTLWLALSIHLLEWEIHFVPVALTNGAHPYGTVEKNGVRVDGSQPRNSEFVVFSRNERRLC